ncbi:MAG TPA: prolyl oligopeptidase family serine peptidase [Phenylobacterium sp.]|uniref:prolyl oligopeptidase family serine peptidase n=1 Tax=Phenylobacterium sp. TaxID=1871053 RepID=UPI002B464C08|nr:prolyl oligopeptidase family serine peptidase [Phenylobacterium sp.]HKR88877.1 prolyl oligopeptidase family serine peptidase [Phenylobacterium sp.]
MTTEVLAASLLASRVEGGPPSGTDEFLWLEAPRGPQALEWARAETKAAHEALAASPDHAEILARLKSLLAAGDPPPLIQLLGPIALKFQRSVAHPHGLLQVAERDGDGVPTAWRTVLDVDALRAREGRAYKLQFGVGGTDCVAPDYRRCILALSPEGGDEVELREFDLDRGDFVEGGFRTPASRAFAAWLDADHLLLEHTVGSAPRLKTGWPAQVVIWSRGTPLEAAKIVMRAAADDALMVVSAMGEGADRIGVVQRAIDYSTFEYRLVRPDGTVTVAELPAKLKMAVGATKTSRHILVQLAEAAEVAGRRLPAESVLAYDTSATAAVGRRVSVLHAPGDGEYVTDVTGGLVASRDRVGLVLERRGARKVVTLSCADGSWDSAVLAQAPVGVTSTFVGADPASGDLLLQSSGFLMPAEIQLHRPGRPAATLFAEAPVLDAACFAVDLKTAVSGDGTEVDYYLLRPAQPKTPGATPTLMTGYGAFGFSLAPGYFDATVGGRSLAIWLERGGALALPLIRGGGERGEAWHLAAIREKRQRSYDDFAAASEALIRDKFTTAAHLGVFGMSNGGLLAAVMGTQRPDLYGAIVSDVPLADMLRFPHMGMGAAWINEYGDPADPVQAQALAAYSPFHNVRRRESYPKFMVTVSTEDNRVGPGHARKLAARLWAAGAEVYFLEDEAGGHGVSDPLSRPELMADRMTFLLNALK